MQISRQLAIQKVWDSPDVIPEVVEVLAAIPDEVWDSVDGLDALRTVAGPFCSAKGCDPDELEQVLSRHLGDPGWKPE